MEAKRPSKRTDRAGQPMFVIEGMEEVIKKDLDSHKIILDRTQVEKLAFREAVSNEVRRKRHFISLLGGKKFNDESLKVSIEQMNINIRHLQDKVKLSDDKIDHEKLIVKTLSDQLDVQNGLLKILNDSRK